MARRRKSGIFILRLCVLYDYLYNVLYSLRRMITSHIVDRATFEKARASHLSLLRMQFDRVPTYSEQYDICADARLYYGDCIEVRSLEDDLKYSEKPKF